MDSDRHMDQLDGVDRIQTASKRNHGAGGRSQNGAYE